MGNLDYKQFSERHRPHIHSPGRTLFVTFRLAGSIPQAVVREYKAKWEWLVRTETSDQSDRIEQFRREWFIKLEDVLHRAQIGPVWLREEAIAAKVVENLHRLDGDGYQLNAYCVMSNHVHVVFRPLLSEVELQQGIAAHPGLSRIMHSMKGRSARECNLILKRTGQFWEHESFDHIIRRGRMAATIRYVLNNPVKAGLVQNWRDWPWSYLSDKL